MMNDKYIYVVLIKAHTGLGRFVRMLNEYPYTHIAVNFDGKMNEFVSFSRRSHENPFDAGFMREKREHYAFGKHKKVRVKIFKIPVNHKEFCEINEYVKSIENDKDYVFNFYSMLTMTFIHGIPIYKALNCMSFTAKIIQMTKTVKLDRPYYKYDIKEMDNLLKDYFYKEVYLTKKNEDETYMRNVSPVEKIGSFWHLNSVLLKRLFRDKLREDDFCE